MAEPGTEKRKPGRPKKVQPGQGSIDFNATPAPKGANQWPKSGSGGPTGNVPSRLSQTHQSGATTRLTGEHKYSRSVRGVSGTPKYSSVTPDFNAVGPNHPQTRAGMGGRPMVSSPVTNPGAVPARLDRGVPVVHTGGAPRRIPGGKFDMPGLKPASPSVALVHQPEIFHARGSTPYQKVAAPKPGAAKSTVDGIRAITGQVKAAKGLSRAAKGRLLGLGAVAAGATALGAGYLMSRRNKNEDAAKPEKATPEVTVPGRNAPPSEGNAADRALYYNANIESGQKSQSSASSSGPSLSDRVRNNQKANRSPEDYLGEAFDATIKRGRDVGRKHLQGMIVRDAVDSDTANKLMSRYDKEIGAQSTLKDYKSKGLAQQFDKENPMKAGRLLDEYRAMGRVEGAAPSGATYKDIKARALR